MSGVLEAITYAMGEQLNELAGVRLGRVAQAAAVGDTEIVLERTLGMDPVGTVVVDNITYTYGSLRDGALGQLSVSTPQGVFQGVQAAHALNAVVTDATQNYSQLDLVRRALFVDTAEGPDLSALGRILGVLRQPAVADDDQYRKLIKAIAYNPRPTVFGLSTALTAMVGAGNFTIVEDPENYPCTVFVYINGTGLLTDEPQGKAYLSAERPATRAGGTFTALGPAVHTGALHLAPSAWWVTVGEQLPSLATADGAATMGPNLLAYTGDESKVTAYVLGPSCHAQRLGDAGCYHHAAALTDASTFDAGMLGLVPDVAQLSTTDARGFALGVTVGTHVVGAGCVRQADGSVGVGLADLSSSGQGALLAGVATSVPQGGLFELHVSRGAAGTIRCTVNGRRVQTLAFAAAATGSWGDGSQTGFDVGAVGGTQVAGKGAIKACGLSAETLTDYASLYDTATVAAANQLTFAQPLVPLDVGRVVRVLSGGGQPDARGLYTIGAVTGQQATVTGPDLGPVNVSGTQLICTEVTPPLTYPDDIGRSITLTGSVLGNNGTYTITQLFEDGGTTPLTGAGRTIACRVATLGQAAPQAESNLGAVLNPNLAPGATAQVVLAGAAQVDLTVAPLVLAPRTPVPFPTAPYQVLVDELFSAHVYDSLEAVNHRLTDGPPPTYLLWPLYLTDPTHFVETYLDDMVAAGVTLKIVVGQEAA